MVQGETKGNLGSPAQFGLQGEAPFTSRTSLYKKWQPQTDLAFNMFDPISKERVQYFGFQILIHSLSIVLYCTQQQVVSLLEDKAYFTTLGLKGVLDYVQQMHRTASRENRPSSVTPPTSILSRLPNSSISDCAPLR
jgi:hypothetical protein